MATDLVNVNLAEKVSERIRASFVDLIPEDAWQKLVCAELERFTTKRNVGYYQHQRGEDRSLLQDMIETELRKRFMEMLKTELDKPEWAIQWGGNGSQLPCAMVEQMVKRMAPELLPAMISGIVQQMVSKIQQEIVNSIRGSSY